MNYRHVLGISVCFCGMLAIVTWQQRPVRPPDCVLENVEFIPPDRLGRTRYNTQRHATKVGLVIFWNDCLIYSPMAPVNLTVRFYPREPFTHSPFLKVEATLFKYCNDGKEQFASRIIARQLERIDPKQFRDIEYTKEGLVEAKESDGSVFECKMIDLFSTDHYYDPLYKLGIGKYCLEATIHLDGERIPYRSTPIAVKNLN